jgi:5-methylcytosine-specific restriction endonuclease McrA
LLTAEGGSLTALLARLKALKALGLADSEGRGIKGDPLRWRPVRRTYDDFLKSPEWAATRAVALKRAGGRCERCGAPAREVHHLTYERVGAERPEDLQALCAPCHRTV